MRADARRRITLYYHKLKSACREPDLSLSGLDPVPLSKMGTHLLASLGSKGKNRNSLACLRNAGSHSAVTYCIIVSLSIHILSLSRLQAHVPFHPTFLRPTARCKRLRQRFCEPVPSVLLRQRTPLPMQGADRFITGSIRPTCCRPSHRAGAPGCTHPTSRRPCHSCQETTSASSLSRRAAQAPSSLCRQRVSSSE